MTTRPASRTAADRSTRIARLGIVFGVVAIVGLVMTGSGSGIGFVVLLVALGGLYVTVDQHFGLRDLATVGPVPVSAIATRPVILPSEADTRSLLPLVSALNADDHCLVRGEDGWRLLSVATVTDIALTMRGTVRLDQMARKAAIVESDVAVDRLPRPPALGETWVVRPKGDDRPLVLTRGALATAAATATVPADVRNLDGHSSAAT